MAHRRSGGFSLRMGQRLRIASAPLADPDALILGEPVNRGPVTPVRVLRSEWIKMRSLRSARLTLVAAVATMIGPVAAGHRWTPRNRR